MDGKTLDEEQEMILQQFRKNMSDLLQPRHDDRFLLRWLRARDFNIREAEKMLREDFKMRKKFKADTVLKDYNLPEIISYVPMAFLGFSKMGHLVRYFHNGSLDAIGVIKSITLQDIMMSVLWILEWDRDVLEQNNRKTKNDVETNVYIIDYTGLRLSQWCSREVFRYSIFLAQKYQDHNPEKLHTLFALNAPSLMVHLYNVVVRPFIAENVWKKIRLYSLGDDSYKEELFSLVPREIVPAYLGGERYEPEGDPTCDGLIKRKPKVPSSFYIKDQMTLKPDDPKIHHKIVRERSVFEIEEHITVPGMILCWEFQTKDHNIKFGLFFKQIEKNIDNDVESTIEELIPVDSTESNIIVEKGEYVCEKKGIYILHFDNKYSWLRSKHLFYKVEVQKPDTDTEN